MAQTDDNKDKVSYGRVAVFGDFEYFQRGDGIYRAPLANPVMTDGYRCGRWECYPHGWTLLSEILVDAFKDN